MDERGRRAPQRARRVAGFSVHLFTASGSAVALLALYAAIDRNFAACFAWLGLALLIDGVDGTLARVARVTETASAIDGVVLDLVIDFLTYVLVPIVALWRSDLMPITLSFWLSVIVVFASGLYFADTRMKTKDYWFRGFPALWNVLAIYLFVLRPPAAGQRPPDPARRSGDVCAGRVRASDAGEGTARPQHHRVGGVFRAFGGRDLPRFRRRACG